MLIPRERNIVAFATLFLACAATASAQSTDDRRPLFDGRTLEGWKHVGPGRFVVEDGMLRTEGGMGLLWYAGEKLGDCIIHVEYKTGTERSNSGVYVRIAEEPTDPWYAVHNGFEVQIADGGKPERRTGSIYTFAPAEKQPGKSLEWNTLEITLKGNRISTEINGTPVADFDASELRPESEKKIGEGDPSRGPRPEAGYIGLQNHDENSIVYFREVSVRPLPATLK
ncbi:3-keto-disaccharide hydrolase [Paludisphaera soli]|uniref:3-keto-disaccharide hydrolase n=1 Tax=Paludisphaera soli TaxID=2712865 RepID=UPI0013EA6C4A|nr:DUF1080 domain-containing protein [Paludisphaera soli]